MSSCGGGCSCGSTCNCNGGCKCGKKVFDETALEAPMMTVAGEVCKKCGSNCQCGDAGSYNEAPTCNNTCQCTNCTCKPCKC